ncbi:hypothetical protein [Methylobacterium persicinum]|uniref:Uncharacterized protein n=1 Tax=Methylobacterium persicinum TaxID=374426 RepID=A0ABU0HF93_9HYPH|nr:hypothetical protein [Methylobacterium persicinum]MDQ0440994.1 hypothetical protein [Methylobacterium persicinum]GJE40001.1 hypothetical protein KHHGKMAE_4091 [Methylobacterium persicinum]
MSKRLFVLSVAVLSAAPALAQGRPSTTAMSCAQASRLVASQGAIVLGTGGPTYDRFVRDRSFCEPTEIARRAFRPTRDNGACLVGYTCYEPSPDDWPGSDF